MTDYLRGNYPLDVTITEPDAATCSPFERAALAKLGGSICFVAKAPAIWRGDA